MLNDRDDDRRVQDPIPGGLRRVPVGDDRVRRPGAARHDLSRAPRRDVDARSADLRIRWPADSVRVPVVPPTGRMQAVPGGAGRARRAPEVAGVRRTPTARASSAITRTSSSTTRPRRVGHRLPRRLARQGRRAVAARRAESEAVGDVREEQLRVPLPAAADRCSTCATGTSGYMEWAQQMGLRRFGEPILIQLYSEVLQTFRLAAQGKRPGRQPPDAFARAHRDATSIRCRSTTRRSRRRPPTLARYPLNAVTQRPMAMYHSWDSQNAWLRQIHSPQLPVRESAHRAGRRHRRRRLDVGGIAMGQGALHGALLARRSSPAPCGRGTRSARRPARGSSRPTRTKSRAASCSIT